MMDGSPRDADLLARALAGRGEAFGELFRRHSTIVYNYCFRRLGSWNDAEDATSLVFLETWRRRREAVDLDGSLLPWLIGVAGNVVRNMSRARRRYDAALFRLAHPPSEPDPAEDVAQRLDDEKRARQIIAVLGTLSRPEQDVVAAVLLTGLTYAEASVALRVPVGTVRSRLSRARKRLGQALDLPTGTAAAPGTPVAAPGTT